MRVRPVEARLVNSSKMVGWGPSKSPRKARVAGYEGSESPYAARSPEVLSSRMTNREKCNPGNCAKGKIGLAGSASPLVRFMESRRSRRGCSCPGAMGATTVKLNWGVIAHVLDYRQ